MDGAVLEQNTLAPTIDAGKTLPWLIYLVFFAVLNETVFNVSTPAISTAVRADPVRRELGHDLLHRLFRHGLGHLRTAVRHLQHPAADPHRHLHLRRRFRRRFRRPVLLPGSGRGPCHPGCRRLGASRAHHGDHRTVLPGGAAGPGVRHHHLGGRLCRGRRARDRRASSPGRWGGRSCSSSRSSRSCPSRSSCACFPRNRGGQGGVDIFGAFLVAVGITALIFFLSFSAWYYLAARARARSPSW